MSPSSVPQASADLRNQALRLALAVTIGLTIETLRGAMLPPLAAIIASQLLIASLPAPGRKLVIMLLVVIAGSATLAYLVGSATTHHPGLYPIGIGLLYLWGFALALHPKLGMLGALFLTMSIVVTATVAVSTAVALVLVIELIGSVITAFGLIYLAHTIFPDRGAPQSKDAPIAAPNQSLSVLGRAALATAIILPLHLYLTADGMAAMVVLLTTATMLRQPALAASTRYSFAFAAGNCLGAGLAALSVLIMSLHATTAMLMALVAASSLWLASQIVRGPALAAIFAPGLVAYTMLFGLTLSPLPIVDGVAVINRVVLIVGAALYALAAVSLLVPLARRSQLTEPTNQSRPVSTG